MSVKNKFSVGFKNEIKMENVDYTKEIDLAIAKVLVLANVINRKTDLCCFIDDVAHCRFIRLRLYKDVKSYDKTPVTFEVRYDEREYDKDNKTRLDEINRCIEFLEETLKQKKIIYNMLHAVREYVIVSYEI